MKNQNDDLRLECVNWDEEQPATLKSKGRNHAVSRKVLTKATRVRFSHRGHEMTRNEARRLNETKVAESRVTPDTTVECPKCGHRFRVGKKLV